METLPNDRIEAALPAALADLAPTQWAEAAEAIMTTDTLPRAASRDLRAYRHRDRNRQRRQHDPPGHADPGVLPNDDMLPA